MFSFFGRRKGRNKGADERPTPEGLIQPPSPPERIYSVGEKIGGRYEVLDAIEGGLGRVYAVSGGADSVIVLKTVKAEAQGESLATLMEEARVWIALGHHPNIVQARWIEEIAGITFIAADYVHPTEQGCITLRDHLDLGGSTPQQIITWSAQFCHGLEYANSKGLSCHRDIKPENLLVGRAGRLRITDFGLARTRQQGGDAVAGTPAYMSPEQWKAEPQDVRTDIYAFGVALHELCFGRKPWASTHVQALRHEHLYQTPIVPTHPLAAVIARCLEKRPTARFRGPTELYEALVQVAQASNLRVPLRPSAAEIAGSDTGRLAKITLLRAQGAVQAALTEAQRLVSELPELSDGWTELGRSFHEVGDLDRAEEAFKHALRLDPTRTAPWNNLGLVLNHKGKPAESVEAFRRALDADPENTGAVANLAGVLAKLGRHLEGIAMLEKAIQLAPDKYNLFVNLSALHQGLGELREACAALDKAIYLAPDREKDGLRHRRAALVGVADDGDGAERYLRERNWEKAIPLLLRRTESAPNDPMHWQNLAIAHLEAGNRREAQAALKRLARLEPENTFAILSLVRVSARSGDRSEAMRWVNVYSELPRYSAKAEAVRAHVHDEFGELGEARKVLTEAMQQYPEEPDLYVAYGSIAIKHGLHSYAVPALESALRVMKAGNYPVQSVREVLKMLEQAKSAARG